MAPHHLTHYGRWAYHRLAYWDVVALYHSRHLYLHLLPYLQNRIEYPVVMGTFLWITSYAPGLLGYFTTNAILIWLSVIGSLFVMREIVPRQYQWFTKPGRRRNFPDNLGMASIHQRYVCMGSGVGAGCCHENP